MHQGFFHRVEEGGGWGMALAFLLLDMPRILNSSLYKSCNDTINGKLCLCENSLRFHQIVSNKRSKIKIFRGPPIPLVCHMFCTRIHICPPPLGKETLHLKDTFQFVKLYNNSMYVGKIWMTVSFYTTFVCTYVSWFLSYITPNHFLVFDCMQINWFQENEN